MMSATRDAGADLTRPIIGIENRTAHEVFDIMCDRIRAATALRLSAGGGWRTMDSAPKDGTEIIIWLVCDDGRGFRISDAFYVENAPCYSSKLGTTEHSGWVVQDDGDYRWIEIGATAKLWAPYPENPASPTVEAGHVE